MEERLVCGVCGGTGAGKTTLVRDLVGRWGRSQVALLAFDSYYHDLSQLPPAERALVNYDHPDSLDVDLFVRHLDALRAGEAIDVPAYDFATHTRRGPTERVEPRSLVLVDGILLLAFPEVRERIDHAVFLDVESEIRFERRLRRDVTERGRTEDSVRSQWATTVEPMHGRFVRPFAEHADVVIDRFDEACREEVADMVADGLRRRTVVAHGA